MPFALSIGDVVALCSVVKDIIQTIDDIKGSSSEYQDITRKSWAFVRVLQEVERFCGITKGSAPLSGLCLSVGCIIDHAQQSVDAYQKVVKKFAPSLCEGGSGNKIRDARMKILWRIRHAADTARFRGEIDLSCSLLNALLAAANG